MTSKSAKEILAYVRKGDFAHPGEIKAIEIAFEPIVKEKSQKLLDVGCGLGGTAHYIQKNGWGTVMGIDLDADLIQYANQHYPDISFILGDILQLNDLIQEKFDVIYSFSAFFCFASQQLALKQMASLANPQAQLIIFDYSLRAEENYHSPFPWSNTASRFNPIDLPVFEQWLLEAGWHLKRAVDISAYFETWYEQLVQLFETHRTNILSQFDADVFDKMVVGYRTLLLEDIKSHQIGGVIIYADRI